MKGRAYLAFDLGAESGRAVLGVLNGHRLDVRELHRFPNDMVNLRGHLHWNIVQLFHEMKRGMAVCAAEATAEPAGVGVDTWGVDFGLLAADGSLLGLPYAYRDARTEGAMEGFFRRVPRERVYELTGIQFLPFNTLFQLFAMARDGSPPLNVAEDLLFMPDIFNYLLTGEKVTEFTFATTSQLYNPVEGGWERELLDALGIREDIMQQIVGPGTQVGPLDDQVREETGLRSARVVATASHDTAAAVAAAPAEGDDWAYISSGTWSLMGVESEKPVITDETLASNFTNEGGVGGIFRLLKNIMGLWLVQQCRKAWANDCLYSYQELSDMASSAPAFKAVVDPDHPDFLNPLDMPEAIRKQCRDTGQPEPETPAELIRCILEGLALKYRLVLDQLCQVRRHPINRIHVIGGGSRNKLLCQFAANATGLQVLAGPAEATAIGNLLVQALALGDVGSREQVREVVRTSFAVERYQPEREEEWAAGYARFRDLHVEGRKG